MIEILILEHLKEKLKIPVFLVQKVQDGNYVVFEKVGGEHKNHLVGSSFAFQSYADTMYKACELNHKVKEAVESLVNYDEVASVNLNSDYNFTDTDIKKYRYQAVFEIKHY